MECLSRDYIRNPAIPNTPLCALVSEAHSEANTPDRCHMAPSKTLEAAPTTLADLLYGCAPLLCRDVSDALRNLPQPVHGYPVRMTLGAPVLSYVPNIINTTIPIRDPNSPHYPQTWWFRSERPCGRGPPVRLCCASLLPTSFRGGSQTRVTLTSADTVTDGVVPCLHGPQIGVPAWRFGRQSPERAWRISPLLREGKVLRLGSRVQLGPRLPGRSWYGLSCVLLLAACVPSVSVAAVGRLVVSAGVLVGAAHGVRRLRVSVAAPSAEACARPPRTRRRRR